MKKGLIVLFIISTFFPCLANATYHLNCFSVQNRVYENGNQLNRLAIRLLWTATISVPFNGCTGFGSFD